MKGVQGEMRKLSERKWGPYTKVRREMGGKYRKYDKGQS